MEGWRRDGGWRGPCCLVGIRRVSSPPASEMLRWRSWEQGSLPPCVSALPGWCTCLHTRACGALHPLPQGSDSLTAFVFLLLPFQHLHLSTFVTSLTLWFPVSWGGRGLLPPLPRSGSPSLCCAAAE